MVDDWECAACGTHNFARREQCFRCRRPRGAPAPGARTDLVVRGLSVLTGEAALAAWAGAHGRVAQVHLVRDRHTGVSRGVGVVRFASAAACRAALHAIRAAPAPPTVDGHAVTVGWASDRQSLDVAPVQPQQQGAQQQQAADGWQSWVYTACAVAAAAAAASAASAAGAAEEHVSLEDALGGAADAADAAPHTQFRVLPSSWNSDPEPPPHEQHTGDDDDSGLQTRTQRRTDAARHRQAGMAQGRTWTRHSTTSTARSRSRHRSSSSRRRATARSDSRATAHRVVSGTPHRLAACTT